MTPTSTYRLQLHAGFTLEDARAVVPYLARLGIGALYLAPVWQAVPGSMHGYDVLAPDSVSAELGGMGALERLAFVAHNHDMLVIADVVPNHQAADVRNARWRSVLAEGEASPFAAWFDIDWRGNAQTPPGRVTLPVLDEPSDDALRSGALRLVSDGAGGLAFDHHGTAYPVRGPVSPAARDGDIDALRALLDVQVYVLGEWRTAAHARNYRRFFDIDSLVGVRVEDPDVFRATHALVIELADEGVLDGVRLDHIDGLADPAGYLRRLADALPPDAWIVVEKILAADEMLPPWPIAGTTGYEWGAALHAAQIHPSGRAALLAAAAADGVDVDYARVEREAKALVLDESFAAEWATLCARLPQPLLGALRELTLCLDVYRTYLVPPQPPSADDRRRIERAVQRAAAAGVSRADLDAVVERLVVDGELARRWQQLSGPVMAKGREDTACYRYPVLISQCEVGADPDDDVHDAFERLIDRASRSTPGAQRPPGQVATSTHDSKRGEDVRARLAAASECADELDAAVCAWWASGAIPEEVAPDEVRFVAQTMLGAWPLDPDASASFADRLEEYLRKALREAKLRTSWLDPDEAHEAVVIDLARRSVAHSSEFEKLFADLRSRIELAGASNSLVQLLLKMVLAPAPDVYQGTETWDLSLVDPDNRRPVDHAAHAAMLAGNAELQWAELRAQWRDGAIKLAVTARLLAARRADAPLFVAGRVARVAALGSRAAHVVALRRALGGAEAVAVGARWPATLAPYRWSIAATWSDTAIAVGDGPWTDALTGATLVADADGNLPLAAVCAELPVALLLRH